LLQAQDEGRVKRLLPIKYGRMGVSPFAFLRGSAAVMADDFSRTPVTGTDQTERDHQTLVEAIASGRIQAETGIWYNHERERSKRFDRGILEQQTINWREISA
jgi:hypothetical protein